MKYAYRSLVLAAICMLGPVCPAGAGGGTAATASQDLLDRPAETSGRAAKYVLLAAARAGRRLVAVGEQGIVLLSDDDGERWRQAKVPTSVTLTKVCFVSPGRGWAVGHGGVVLASRDGGETWVRQFDGREAAQRELEAAKAAAAQGEASANRRLREAARLLDEGPDKPLLDVWFADENNGLVVGAYGAIFATGDGGNSWRPLRHLLDDAKGRHLYSIHVAGRDLYIAGEQGALYHSADGAKSFTAIRTPYVGTLFGAVSAGDGALVVFGLRGNAYRSGDGGASWHKIDLAQPVTVSAGARLADGSLVLVDETGRVLRSDDGGLRFSPVNVPQPSPFAGVVQAADGSLVLPGARGLTRVPLSTALLERNK